MGRANPKKKRNPPLNLIIAINPIMKLSTCQAKIYASAEHFQNVLINYEFEWTSNNSVDITYLKIMQRIRIKPSGLEEDLEASILRDFQVPKPGYGLNENLRVSIICEVEEAFTTVRV